jgi:Protein of unknown function (DUF3748)
MTSSRKLTVLGFVLGLVCLVLVAVLIRKPPMPTLDHVILTQTAEGHNLTNVNVWSADSQWIVFDTRSDKEGTPFDGDTIKAVHVETGEVRTLYTSVNGAKCGVATWSQTKNEVYFILGPEHPTPEYSYGFSRRRGVIVNFDNPGVVRSLDARNLVAPFTSGALRGGSHVHVGSADRISFTYDDDVLRPELNQRNVAVSFPKPVVVPKTHERNHDGEYFSVLVTRTVQQPKDGSDEISKAFEEGWIGTQGYAKPDGTRQRWALAFQGHVNVAGKPVPEVFVVDLPDDLTQPSDAPLEGKSTTRPAPPKGTIQRRLTDTTHQKYPGLQGPRHWLRSSPDGSMIAFLRKDPQGVVQLFTISPNGGDPKQLTNNQHPISSAFTWHPGGQHVAFVMDRSVCVVDLSTGVTTRVTERRADEESSPRADACVVSPDGTKIAYLRRLAHADGGEFNQICVVPFSCEPRTER